MDGVQPFLEWAWERHHNVLSWYIRPLFILPYCWFAYRRNLAGLGLTIIALLSSMFWFPAPDTVDPQVEAFLAMERDYLTGSWGPLKVAWTLMVPVFFISLAWVFWRRSWRGGFLVVNLAVAGKVGWSFLHGDDTAWSLIPAALGGMAVCNAVLLLWWWRTTRARG